jgi:hippurate hydrolase
MRRVRTVVSGICLLILFATLPVGAQTGVAPAALKTQIDQQMPELIATYKQLHQHPELSHQEEQTSAYLAGELRKAGYEVTEHVGKYGDGSAALGIVGILKNGAGPVVLIRTDMDALPVTEATGLDYASRVRSQNAEKQDVGVMHACGHDIHMTVLLGVAHELAANKDHWHGTVELVGEPAEETIDGAKAMLADGMYDRFPRPDYILAQHDTNDYEAGHIAIRPGPMLASATSVKVVFHGIGAHGSKPSSGKDPIVMAAEFVMLVQTVVSRQISTLEPAVLTVGTFHAGTKNNIIPDDAVLGLSLRAYSEEVRQKLLDGVKRTANGVATAYGVAPDRMPEVTVFESTVPTINDAALTERVRSAAEKVLGAANVEAATPVMGSEDVGYFSLDGKIPFVFFWLGAADPEKLAASKNTGIPLPGIHSALFAPVFEPTIRTGVSAMTAAALDLLQR